VAHDDYRKLYERRNELDKASARGDSKARADRAKVAEDLRKMERAAAREGTVLSGGQVVREDAPTKRSLQEEYCRNFTKGVAADSAEPVVRIVDARHPESAPFVGTRSAYHRKRLLGK
jgi:hypothetical protein